VILISILLERDRSAADRRLMASMLCVGARFDTFYPATEMAMRAVPLLRAGIRVFA